MKGWIHIHKIMLKIIIPIVILGIILYISTTNTLSLKEQQQGPIGISGNLIYAGNNHTVHLDKLNLTIKDNLTENISQITLPAPEYTARHKKTNSQQPRTITENDSLLVTMERTVYVIDLNEAKILGTYPDPGSKENKIIVDKHKNLLFLYKEGSLLKTYNVATGKQPNFTPEGAFTITNKYSVTPNSGNERFGPRWLGISVPNKNDLRSEKPDQRAPAGIKYGIHGTDEPNSIGSYASGGCIRLKNKDILEIYELVDIGTPVEIIR